MISILLVKHTRVMWLRPVYLSECTNLQMQLDTWTTQHVTAWQDVHRVMRSKKCMTPLVLQAFGMQTSQADPTPMDFARYLCAVEHLRLCLLHINKCLYQPAQGNATSIFQATRNCTQL